MDYTVATLTMDENGIIRIDTDNNSSKKREFKGTNANRHVDNYCVLDLETTGVFVGSSRIIEVSALKVRNNQVVNEYSTLINPHCHIPAEATAVNHITDDMVKDAPSLNDIIDSFLAFVEDDIIVGYNNASFDMNLIYDSVQKLRSIPFSNNYIDLLYASRRSIEGLENYKLKTISKHYGLDTTGEHRALKDCYLTKDCYDKLYEEFGDSAFMRRSHSSSGRGYHYSAETLAIRELHSLLEGMLEDGKIDVDEVDSLRFWLEEHIDLSGIFPFDKAFNALNDVLEDGIITPEEHENLKSVFIEINNPVKSQCSEETITSLKNQHICLTGDFEYGSKSDVMQLVYDAGGLIDKTVKKATNYLVVGSLGSGAWKAGNYGGKIQKAIEYNSKGTNIIIVEEKTFIPAIKYIIEHPNEEDSEITESFISKCLKPAIQSMLDDVVLERKLPEHSLYITENFGRDGDTITSYSICIYEPEYPEPIKSNKDATRNSIVLNLKEAKYQKIEIIVGTKSFRAVKTPEEAEVKILKSDTLNAHILISIQADSIIPYLKKQTEFALDNYEPKGASFGCCSKYLECSRLKHCIHENLLYSKACAYRKNLESGKVFYGETE